MAGDDTARGPVGRYRERLLPAWWVWAVAAALAAAMGLVVARVDGRAAWVTAVVAAAAEAAFLLGTAPLVQVGPDHLVAGRARVPLAVLGQAQALDAEAMRRARGPRLDARAYLCLRGWVAGGVRVTLNDPADPTPYWLVSSTDPTALARAITTATEAAGRSSP